MTKQLHVLHVNSSFSYGGAARAASRIHVAIHEYGLQQSLISSFRVISGSDENSSVTAGSPPNIYPLGNRLRPKLNRLARRGFSTCNPSFHSIAWPDSGLGNELHEFRGHGVDLLHLHWIGEFNGPGDVTISIEELGRLPHPLVWTLHDQWAFCGAEHYTNPPGPGECESSDIRYQLGYSRSSRPKHERGPDLNRRTWLRKRRSWRRPMEIVCPSNWLAECARRSTLMGDWPITVIPNPVDLGTWAPWDKRLARQLLQLPQEPPIVLFGAMGGTEDPRKGADLLLASLQRLKAQLMDSPLAAVELAVFGQSAPVQPPDLGFPIHYMGRLQDDLSLRLLYAAADVFVIPSRQDNLPNTGLEAHACGTPVVAFRTGGLPDIVDHLVTGALAEPFSPDSLANSIRWVLEDSERRCQLASAARRRAESLWDPARVAGLYVDIYRRSVGQNGLQDESVH